LVERPDGLRRFLDEGRRLPDVAHPNLVRATTVLGEPPAVVAELLECPLLAVSMAGRRFSAEEAVEVVAPLLAGLAEASLRGFLHLGIRPDRILMGPGRPILGGLGVAQLVSTLAGGFCPSAAALQAPAYRSPEQIQWPRSVDTRTDVYAVGVILYELITGHRAFSAASEATLERDIVEGVYEAPERLEPSLPPALHEVIRTAIDAEPTARFPDCASFGEALIEAAKPLTPPAPWRAPPGPEARPDGRKRWPF
jgi:serine/threonine-protein kinase